MKALSGVVLGFFGCVAALGQSEEASPTGEALFAQVDTVVLDPAAMPEEPARPAAEPPPVLETTNPTEPPPMVQARLADRKWRSIRFGAFQVSSSDNLFISATDRRSDVSFQVSAGLAVGWGNFGTEVRQLGPSDRYFEPLNLTVEDVPKNFIFGQYYATASFFAENSDENAVDHDALIAGRWEGGKLTLGLRLHFQTLSGPDVDVGDRAQRTLYGGEITSNYAVSEKTSLEVNVYNRSYDYDDQLDWSEWMVENWVNYQIRPKTKISLGTRLGTALVESQSDQTFEQLVARVVYLPTVKLGLSLDGGVEWRQYGSDERNDVFSVFNFSATYTPFDGTQLSANSYRRNSASVSLADENITATGVSARARQRILQRYYVAVEGGYQDAAYTATGTAQTSGRDDETTYVKPSVSFDVTRYLSAEAAYQHRRNESSNADLSFTENVFSLQLNLQF